MLSRFLHLRGDELRRLLPFFALYFLLFCVLSMADGLSIALFVKRVGASELPRYYALTAGLNLVLIGVYVARAEAIGGARAFQLILGITALTFAGTWTSIVAFEGGREAYGLLFAAREVAYTLLVMHFGTFLQDYFTRLELNRVLMIVYAGGRVGGIVGGLLLEVLAPHLGLANVLLICIVLCVVAMITVALTHRFRPMVDSPADEKPDPGIVYEEGEADLMPEALRSLRGFLKLVFRSPLLRWTTISSLVFMGARWVLNYQYNSYFEDHFESDVALASFMGRYTQLALAASLFLQLIVMNRLVATIGVKASNLIYAAMVTAALLSNTLHMSFAQAIVSRALETELRFGVRNPINQLIVNKLSKALRVRVRAWSLGVLIPVATLITSGSLTLLAGSMTGIAWLGAALGVAYLGSSIGVNGSFREGEEPCRSES